jgi:hypothetical protein
LNNGHKWLDGGLTFAPKAAGAMRGPNPDRKRATPPRWIVPQFMGLLLLGAIATLGGWTTTTLKSNTCRCEKVTRGDITVDVQIYRIAGSAEGWSLEVTDENGTSSVWDDLFTTDRDAYAEFQRTIDTEGTWRPESGWNWAWRDLR